MIAKKDEQKFLEELKKVSLFLREHFYTTEYYSFEDILLVPTYLDEAISRKSIDTSVYINKVKYSLPVISSPMSFYTQKFGKELTKHEVIYSVPRINKTLQERIEILKEVNNRDYSIFSFGIKEIKDFLENFTDINSFSNFYLLDIAHGASRHTVNVMYELSNAGITKNLVVGNIASVEGFLYLLFYANELGFENIYIRVGIGSGSACTTRLKTGIGFPQFSIMLILDVIRKNFDADIFDKESFSFLNSYMKNMSLKGQNIFLISDGGIREYGDIPKALLHSDFVMLGKMFISKEMDTYNEENDTAEYYGMASKQVGKSDFVEGDVYKIKNPMDLKTVIKEIKQALSSSMSYVNAKNLEDFKKNATYIKVSKSVITESNVYKPK